MGEGESGEAGLASGFSSDSRVVIVGGAGGKEERTADIGKHLEGKEEVERREEEAGEKGDGVEGAEGVWLAWGLWLTLLCWLVLDFWVVFGASLKVEPSLFSSEAARENFP